MVRSSTGIRSSSATSRGSGSVLSRIVPNLLHRSLALNVCRMYTEISKAVHAQSTMLSSRNRLSSSFVVCSPITFALTALFARSRRFIRLAPVTPSLPSRIS